MLLLLRRLAVLPERELWAAGLIPPTGDWTSDPVAVLDGLKVWTAGRVVDVEAAFGLDNGPFSRSWLPGSPPKRGNSNWKLLLLLFNMELKPPAGAARLTPVLF